MPVVLKPVHLKLTAIIEPSDKVFVALCPELDLATEGDTPEAALSDLIDMTLDYSDQYMADLPRSIYTQLTLPVKTLRSRSQPACRQASHHIESPHA